MPRGKLNKNYRKRRTLKRIRGTGGAISTDRSIFASMQAGLGNQLFIYAAAIIVKNKLKLPLYLIPPSDNKHSNIDYITKLFKEGKIYTNSDLGMRVKNAQIIFSDINKPSNFFKNTNILYNNKGDVYLKHGYYQSYESIKLIIPKIRSDLISIFKEKYPELNTEFKNISNISAFMHVRRGDFVDLNMALTAKYFQDALDLLMQNKNIKYLYILSNDINWCKGQKWNSHNVEFKYVDNVDELYSIYLMSLCMAGAILSNSSFSKWGAYLGVCQNKDARIICPKSNEDENPKEWIGLKVNSE
jgi:hypothetical protein